jgi:hypothetical protein
MFGNDPRDLCQTLSTMETEARRRCNYNQIEAKTVLKSWIGNDKRFSDFDPDILAARVVECKNSAASLDLSDPRLRGQPARPLERSKW